MNVTKGGDAVTTNDFGKFLAQLRKEKGLTQVELAERLNVSDKAVSRWETGKNYPDISLFQSISNVLDISISELLEGKRVNAEELVSVSEGHTIHQMKQNKKLKRVSLLIISIILAFTLWFGYLAARNSGIFDGVIYNEIPCYSNDLMTMMNNLDGYIQQRPKADGEFIIDYGFLFMESDKTTKDILYLSGTCENGRAFYINTLYDEQTPENSSCFIGEFRKNQQCVEGITFDDLKSIVAQMDLSQLPPYEKYELSLSGIVEYDRVDVTAGEGGNRIKKMIYEDGILQEYKSETLSGKYMLIHISGFTDGNGKGVVDVFYVVN